MFESIGIFFGGIFDFLSLLFTNWDWVFYGIVAGVVVIIVIWAI